MSPDCNNPTRVVFCAYGPNVPGGPTSWLQRMMPLLMKRGIASTVLSVRTSPGSCRFCTALRKLNIPVRTVRHVTNQRTGAKVRAIASAIAQLKPDVLVADHVEDAFIAGACIANLPVVMVVRSDSPQYKKLRQRFVTGDERLRVSAIVAVSEELEDSLSSTLPKGIRLMRCPSSVPMPSTRASHCDTPFRAVYLGRLEDDQKRVSATLDTMISISRKHPWFSATIYGEGTALKNLRQRLEAEGTKQIQLAGPLKLSYVYPALLESQAFVLLSAFEGLSTAMQEAMACGVPVIMRRCQSGQRHVLSHGVNGFIIEEDNELEACLASMATDVELWRKLSDGAAHTARVHFDIENAADRWSKLLNELASNNRRSPQPRSRSQQRRRLKLFYEAEADVASEHLLAAADFAAHDLKSIGPKLAALIQDPTIDWDARLSLFHRLSSNAIRGSPEWLKLLEHLINEQMQDHVSAAISGRLTLASLAKGANQYHAALSAYKTLLGKDLAASESAHVCFHIGDIYFRLHEHNKARSWLVRAVAFDTHSAAQDLLNILDDQ